MPDLTVTPPSRIPEGVHQMNASEAFEPSKPQLIPRLIAAHRSIGKTHEQLSHHLLDRTESEKNNLETWCKKELDHRLAQANRSWIETTWSGLDLVVNSIVGIMSLTAGYYVIAAGTSIGAGTVLVAAGVLNLLQTFLNYFGVWDKVCEILAEKTQSSKDQLKLVLPFMLFFFNIAFTLLGYSAYTHFISHSNLIAVLGGLRTFLSVANQTGQSFLSIKKAEGDVNLVKIQGELKYHEQNADLLSRLVEFCIQESKQIKSNLKKPINTLLRATELAAQRA